MRPRTIALLAIVAVLAMGQSVDHEGPTLHAELLSVDGDTAHLAGDVEFPPIEHPESVGGFVTAFENPDVASQVGIALHDALIEPLADGSGLRFVWDVDQLPPTGVLPEGVRYTWAFQIDGEQFQLQAKTSNLLSSTTVEDPVGHAQQAGDNFFQLRGACQDEYLGTPVSGCYHLAFLDGDVDVDAGTIAVELPYDTHDSIGRSVAPEFVPGATLIANETASMSITASLQAVVSNTATSQYINSWTDYFAGPRLELGVGRSFSDPTGVDYTVSVPWSEDGTWSGSVSGLGGANDTVFVRACNGASCDHATFTVDS